MPRNRIKDFTNFLCLLLFAYALKAKAYFFLVLFFHSTLAIAIAPADLNAYKAALTIDSSANLKFNSGFGSVSTAFGCRAWVRFDGTGTASINGSGNVSSLTDQGVGNIDVNFTNNMPDGNYCVSLSLGRGLLATGNQQFPITVPTVGNVGYFETASRQCDNDNNTFAAADADQICASVFR